VTKIPSAKPQKLEMKYKTGINNGYRRDIFQIAKGIDAKSGKKRNNIFENPKYLHQLSSGQSLSKGILRHH
tara:strand:+ start:1020 stop:1232 length:213 start_codon:yes stop_codon:yes gene_type:complete